ncbi:acetyl-CoA C-acyltransferase [Tabrizicola sp. J26]|uniref:acetyl-CoA C-acyltransferase n=1 Tax=Alitabrizicola rongguiensis TaxID=2909234 RepID=UPI001F1FAE49|nr:acetyl-CoA C-acyltransferase [Tabrizicola rongguiensis]MCF1708940.1 acetyl-CoA C-acyltransferase [Tabrizicola rongguiensis]
MNAWITAAFRTPVASRGGGLAGLHAHELAAPLVAPCLAAAGLAPDQVDEMILSNVLGEGGNPARLAALAAGLPERVAGLTIDRQCAGGLDAILLAAALVNSGQADAVLAGGSESYSRRPLRLRTDPAGGAPTAYDQARFTPWPDRDPDMAAASAALAERLGIARAEQEAWAVSSHAKALAAQERLRSEIIPLAGLTDDAFTRRLSPAIAARARPIAGSITAATAAVAADGAALCLVVSDKLMRRAPKALRILGGVTLGARPDEPGLAPIPAIKACLAKAGVATDRIGQAEIMEAYAVQAMACISGAGLDPARVNPGGGALARGHPVGASGAILATRLFHDLSGGIGLAAIAAAGGIGTALLVQD